MTDRQEYTKNMTCENGVQLVVVNKRTPNKYCVRQIAQFCVHNFYSLQSKKNNSKNQANKYCISYALNSFL